MGQPLEDVVALVVSRPLGPVDTKQVLARKLESLGARVAGRLGKEITHIIFQRQRGTDKHEQDAENDELRILHDKAAKMDFPVVFVSPLWIERCLFEKKRVMERKFTIPRPASNLFTYCKTPGSGPGKAGAKKPLRRKSVQPKAPDEYQVDTADFNFSSSQQMRGEQNPEAEGVEVASPLIRMEENGSDGMTVKVAHSKSGLSNGHMGFESTDEEGHGLGTQLAAEMLTGLGEDLASTSMQEAQEMLVSMKIGHQHSASKACHSTDTRARSAPSNKKAAGLKRKRAASTGSLTTVQKRQRAPSRLRQRSNATPRPVEQEGTASPLKFCGQRKRTACVSDGSERMDRARELLEAQENVDPGAEDALQEDAACSDQEHSPGPQSSKKRQLHIESKGHSNNTAPSLGAPRVLRNVDSRLEQQLPIVRQAMRPVQPTPPEAVRCKIPTREVRRVDSPWSESGASPAFACPSKLQPAGVWSQARPWDPKQPASSSRKFIRDSPGETLNIGAAQHEDAAFAVTMPAEGPTQGCLAMTSVEPAIVELGKAALRQLRGLRMCPSGVEDQISHLIIEKERRTLKVLLAITNGAWLLTPAWLTASLEAGCWLPEAPFQATVRFSAAARRAKASLSKHSKAILLEGKQIYFHAANGKGKSSNVPVLKRLAAALGAKVVNRIENGGIDLCIVVGDSSKSPASLLPECAVVREEWLLQTVENYAVPPNMEAFRLK